MKKIYTISLLLFALMISAQSAGKLDSNFGTNGSVTTFTAQEYYPRTVDFEDYTGNIYAAGHYQNGTTTIAVVNKFDFYGNPIATFGTNGVLVTNNHSTVFQRIEKIKTIGSNGNFLTAGNYKDANNIFKFYISAYNASGTVNTAFGVNGSLLFDKSVQFEILNNYLYVQTSNVNNKPIIRKFSLTGTEDLTYNFTVNSSTNTITGYDFLIENNGGVLISGTNNIGGTDYEYIEKHLPNGAIDTSFATNGYFQGNAGYVQNIIFQKNGANASKILCLVNGSPSNSPTSLIKRLNSNGSLDTTFGTSGNFNYTFPFSGNWIDNIVADNLDNIILCGSKVNSSATSEMMVMGTSANGNFNYLTTNDVSSYSENWSMTKIPNSFLLTFGCTYNTAGNLYTNKVKRYFMKPAVISLIGAALQNGGNTDVALSTTDNQTYFINNLSLSAGALKFRLDGNWLVNWGAGTSNPFPTAMSTMGQSDIIVPTAGIYNVTFNIKTGVYNFQNSLSINSFYNQKINISPNPASTTLNIQSQDSIIDLKIIDITGRSTTPSFENNKIDVSNLANGIYLLEATTTNGTFREKFIKN